MEEMNNENAAETVFPSERKAFRTLWLKDLALVMMAAVCLLTALAACGQRKEEMSREQEVAALETEMIDFFQETLERNYGRKDAVDLLAKGMLRYEFNYLLDVDKRRMREINEKLYKGGWLFSYFLEGRNLADSCNVRLFIPKGMKMKDFYQTDAYRRTMEDVERRKAKGAYVNVTVVTDSLRYAMEKAQVKGMTLPFKKQAADGFSYWQRELEKSSHPALKKLRDMEKMVGIPPSSLVWGMLSSNSNNICADFRTNREVQLYLTLYLWNFLCHFANVDFYTGQDRTEAVMEQAKKEQEYIILGVDSDGNVVM